MSAFMHFIGSKGSKNMMYLFYGLVQQCINTKKNAIFFVLFHVRLQDLVLPNPRF